MIILCTQSMGGGGARSPRPPTPMSSAGPTSSLAVGQGCGRAAKPVPVDAHAGFEASATNHKTIKSSPCYLMGDCGVSCVWRSGTQPFPYLMPSLLSFFLTSFIWRHFYDGTSPSFSSVLGNSLSLSPPSPFLSFSFSVFKLTSPQF